MDVSHNRVGDTSHNREAEHQQKKEDRNTANRIMATEMTSSKSMVARQVNITATAGTPETT
jgi:hypothetical protein